MILTYLFNGEEFDYSLGLSEIQDYVESLSSDEAVDLVKESFYVLDKDTQHDILRAADEPNFACPNFAQWVEDDLSFCVSEIIMEPDALYRLEDELHDFYEDDAYNRFTDSQMDDYESRGLKPSDFY